LTSGGETTCLSYFTDQCYISQIRDVNIDGGWQVIIQKSWPCSIVS